MFRRFEILFIETETSVYRIAPTKPNMYTTRHVNNVWECVWISVENPKMYMDKCICITYLTLVHPVVPSLHKFYLKCPCIWSGRVKYCKSLVVCVHLRSGRQNVPISSSNPGYLILRKAGDWKRKNRNKIYEKVYESKCAAV